MQNPQSGGVFECVVWLVVPAIDPPPQPGDKTYQTLSIAKFNFDPGFQVEEEVWVSDFKVGWSTAEHPDGEPFDFKTMVTERRKEILARPEDQGSVFRLSIILQPADRERVARMVEVLRQLNRDMRNFPL